MRHMNLKGGGGALCSAQWKVTLDESFSMLSFNCNIFD